MRTRVDKRRVFIGAHCPAVHGACTSLRVPNVVTRLKITLPVAAAAADDNNEDNDSNNRPNNNNNNNNNNNKRISIIVT